MLGGRMELGLVPGINTDYFRPFGLDYTSASLPHWNSSTTFAQLSERRSPSLFTVTTFTPQAPRLLCSHFNNRIRRFG